MRWTLAAILAVPVVELIVLIEVGRAIGTGWTILALLALMLLGGFVLRRAGARAVRTLSGSVDNGRVPGAEMAGPVLMVVAGVLLAIPGFVTAAFGLLLLLPPVQKLAGRRWQRQLAQAAADRAAFLNRFGGGAGAARGPEPGAPAPGPRRPGGVVITGEVIDDPGHPGRPREPGAPS